LARDVLQLRLREVATMDFQSCGTTLLLVDGDIEQLELRASAEDVRIPDVRRIPESILSIYLTTTGQPLMEHTSRGVADDHKDGLDSA
jgi:hypothetical protein